MAEPALEGVIGDIRGAGLMLGVEFAPGCKGCASRPPRLPTRPALHARRSPPARARLSLARCALSPGTRIADDGLAGRVSRGCYERGMLLLTAGHRQTIRFVPGPSTPPTPATLSQFSSTCSSLPPWFEARARGVNLALRRAKCTRRAF